MGQGMVSKWTRGPRATPNSSDFRVQDVESKVVRTLTSLTSINLPTHVSEMHEELKPNLSEVECLLWWHPMVSCPVVVQRRIG